MQSPRPIHLIIIDSWHPRLLLQELDRLPAMAHLLRAGLLDPGCISTFPTVTPTALSTLVTGTPPGAHGIQGIMWYSRSEDRYVHYWPSPQSLRQGTLPRVLRDILVDMNGAHLAPSTPTLFELLERAGLDAGCVNFPISRGGHQHPIKLPWLIRWASGLGKEIALSGPRHFYYGDVLRPLGFKAQGPLFKYGLTDRRAGAYGARMIREARPAFQLVYLNEHDLRSHQHGPMACAYSLRIIDRQLAKLMDAYGSWDAAVREARWVLVGDHAQSPIGGFPGYAIDVYRAFKTFRVAPLGGAGLKQGPYDLAIAPNDRSALLYLADRTQINRLLDELRHWPSIEQIAWKNPEDGWTTCMQAGTGRVLSWKPEGPHRDAFGRHWSLKGDWSVLDLRQNGASLLDGDFPDALGRLEGSLSGECDMVITAKLGYEFTTGFTMGKGNHGSLHREDSCVPLLTVGLTPPQRPMRTQDVVPMILDALEIDPPGHLIDRRAPWSSFSG
jgi:hypothetical protein